MKVPLRALGIIESAASERGVSVGQLIGELVNEGSPFGGEIDMLEEIADEERLREQEMLEAALEAEIREACGDGFGLSWMEPEEIIPWLDEESWVCAVA